MELWIRNQDKENLIKVDALEICEEFDDDEDFVYEVVTFYRDKDVILGYYKTKERALEVLDEIQNILQPRLIVHQPNIDYDDIIHSLTEDIYLRTTQKVDMELKQAGQVVYQMPKE